MRRLRKYVSGRCEKIKLNGAYVGDLMLSEKTICNLIKGDRRYGRENIKTKSITKIIDKENNVKIATRTDVMINIKTNNISISCSLRFGRNRFCPTVHGKRNCNSESLRKHISEFKLKNHRKYNSSYYGKAKNANK